MAIGKKAAPKKKLRVASMKPSEMHTGGGGLDTGFHATIEEVRVVEWDYDGKRDENVLAVRVSFRPHEDQPDDAVIRETELEKNDGLIIQHYSAGKLDQFVPSEDGGEQSEEGIYAIPTDELIEKLEAKGVDVDENPPELNSGTNWAFFLRKLMDAGIPEDDMEANVDWLEGKEVRCDRVNQPPRSGVSGGATGEGGEQRQRQILVVTELLEEKPKKGAAKKGATKAAPAAAAKKGAASKKAASNGGGDIDEAVSEAIVAALEKAGGTLSRAKLHKAAMEAVGTSQKKAALALVNDDAFFEGSDLFELDTEENTVTLLEAEE